MSTILKGFLVAKVFFRLKFVNSVFWVLQTVGGGKLSLLATLLWNIESRPSRITGLSTAGSKALDVANILVSLLERCLIDSIWLKVLFWSRLDSEAMLSFWGFSTGMMNSV